MRGNQPVAGKRFTLMLKQGTAALLPACPPRMNTRGTPYPKPSAPEAAFLCGMGTDRIPNICIAKWKEAIFVFVNFFYRQRTDNGYMSMKKG